MQPENLLATAHSIIASRSQFGAWAEYFKLNAVAEATWAVPVLRCLQETGRRGLEVLDLGSGYGTLATAAMLDGHRVTAVERIVPQPNVVGVRWLRGDIQQPFIHPDLPRDGETFDVVTMTEVLEHLNFDPLPLFAEVCRRLVRGGMFLGSTPIPERWPEPALLPCGAPLPEWSADAPQQDAHIKLYAEEELRALLRAAGLVTVVIRPVGMYRYYWRADKP